MAPIIEAALIAMQSGVDTEHVTPSRSVGTAADLALLDRTIAVLRASDLMAGDGIREVVAFRERLAQRLATLTKGHP